MTNQQTMSLYDVSSVWKASASERYVVVNDSLSTETELRTWFLEPTEDDWDCEQFLDCSYFPRFNELRSIEDIFPAGKDKYPLLITGTYEELQQYIKVAMLLAKL